MNPRLFELAVVSTQSRSTIAQMGKQLHERVTGKVDINGLLQFLKKLDDDLRYLQNDIEKCSRYLL
jgi:hypothetical protein